MKRDCEKCGTEMPADVPRQRVAGLFVCEGCTGHKKIAHDMSTRDPLVVRHCAFCGSGQVVARNDGSVECGFCQSVFTIRIEPFYMGWPQTVNGTPQDLPLHPNESGDNAGGFPGEEGGFDSEEDEFGEEDDDQFGAGFEDEGEEFDDEDDEEEEEFDFGKKSFLTTAFGGEVDEESYIKHLAIRLADDNDRDRIIDSIRMVQ